MRFLVPSLMVPTLALLAVGCAPGDASDFQYEATFAKRTSGVILHADGESGGHAGMFGTNCPFDAQSGMTTGDYDLPGEGEEVQDGEPTTLGDLTFAAVLDGTVHVVDKTGGEYTHVPVSTPGVEQARLAFDTIVVLDQACRVKQLDLAGQVLATHALDGCADGDIEVDPATATGVVAALGNTVRFDAAGVHPIALSADLVAYDGWADQYYLARRGSTELSAVGPDGAVRWTIETPFPVASLQDAGKLESAAVVLEKPDGRGLIAFFDSVAGDATFAGDTPSPATDLAVSDDGRMLGLVRPEQTFFFSLMD